MKIISAGNVLGEDVDMRWETRGPGFDSSH